MLIGPENIANTEMKMSFAIRGKKGTTYTVELYVEAEGTGEKAEWLRSATLVPDGRAEGEEGTARDEFKLRSRFPDEPASATLPHLPFARSNYGWSILLVIREMGTGCRLNGTRPSSVRSQDVHVPK